MLFCFAAVLTMRGKCPGLPIDAPTLVLMLDSYPKCAAQMQDVSPLISGHCVAFIMLLLTYPDAPALVHRRHYTGALISLSRSADAAVYVP
jgi:hypothetical protein